MKIAVCFSGGLRTFKLCYKNVISHFEKLGQVDIFISTWEKPCYTQDRRYIDIHATEGNSNFAELLDKDAVITEKYLRSISTFAAIDIESMNVMEQVINTTRDMKWTTMSPSRLICQYYKMDRCNRLKKSYEEKHNIIYNLNVRARCDIKIQSIPEYIDIDSIYFNRVIYENSIFYEYMLEITSDENNKINEMFFIANNANMDKICNIYKNFTNLWWEGGYGEGVSYRSLVSEKLIQKCKIYDFGISVHRANGTISTLSFSRFLSLFRDEQIKNMSGLHSLKHNARRVMTCFMPTSIYTKIIDNWFFSSLKRIILLITGRILKFLL